MSNLKVIACSVNLERYIRVGCKYPDHNQDIQSLEDHFKMFQAIIDLELSQDAGVPCDILIVENGGCNDFFRKYNGKNTKNGKIIVRKRPNEGGSFGAYSFAYEHFKYDTYLFTEDDLFIYGDEYYKKLLDKMEKEQADFVAVIGLSVGDKHPTHAHGGVGLAKRSTLDKIAVGKKLPHPKGRWARAEAIAFGEIPFTNNMISQGLKVIQYGTHDWHPNNLIMPYHELKNV